MNSDYLEFERCDTSGHLKAIGNHGDYWVEELTWTYLTRVTPTPAGPAIEEIGTFDSVIEAILHAQKLDET